MKGKKKNLTEIGERIWALRKWLGGGEKEIPEDAFAALLGFKVFSIQRWNEGRQAPSPEALAKILALEALMGHPRVDARKLISLLQTWPPLEIEQREDAPEDRPAQKAITTLFMALSPHAVDLVSPAFGSALFRLIAEECALSRLKDAKAEDGTPLIDASELDRILEDPLDFLHGKEVAVFSIPIFKERKASLLRDLSAAFMSKSPKYLDGFMALGSERFLRLVLTEAGRREVLGEEEEPAGKGGDSG